MPTKADIFKLAFGHLGIVCIGLDRIGPALDLQWTIALTATLRGRRWDFAVRRKAMSQMPDPVPGFHYAYACPEDSCLPHCIFQTGYHERDHTIHPFKVMRSLDGRHEVIATDASSAGLEYTSNSVEPAEFDPHFTDALSWRLAAEITASPCHYRKAGRRPCVPQRFPDVFRPARRDLEGPSRTCRNRQLDRAFVW